MQSFIPSQQPQINLGANGLGKLDNVVAAAEKYNIKLIIPFVNFWNDYGGIQVYADYYGIKKTDFYTNAAAQTQYKKYIATIVNKYKASTSIFAWELGNEPRCPGCATSVIYNWATDVSAYIKSLDSGHMVTLGDEGWLNGGGDGSYAYTTAEGVDFVKNLDIKVCLLLRRVLKHIHVDKMYRLWILVSSTSTQNHGTSSQLNLPVKNGSRITLQHVSKLENHVSQKNMDPQEAHSRPPSKPGRTLDSL